MAGLFTFFRNMGEVIYCFLSVKRAAWIRLTLGVAFSWKLMFLAVRSPIRALLPVRDITLGLGFYSDAIMLELRKWLINGSCYVGSFLPY